MIQMMQGSLTLGMGIWLVMSGMLVAGTAEIIVNSMLATRAIAPLILLASSIQVIINGRDALKRLNDLLQFYKEPQETMKLPPPKGQLVVENLSVNDPITYENILRSINFQMQAGQTLAILGPSASGKSSLARLLVGVWPPYSGSARLDGVNIFIWNKEELGSQIGYLPQEIELFEGTIAENIARFGKLDNLAVENAAKLVGIHDFICSLEMGYDHLVSDNGANFSGGQRQRIGLARAFYGLPKYIVLDEPNAHLDEQSELDLLNAIDYMKSKGSSVIVITHKVKIIAKLDLILIMAHGMVKTFGKSDEILSKINATTLPIKN